jgi:hypothetical protein
LSEPQQETLLVRAGDTAGFSNPILHIEELRRFPLNRSRVPPPGTALVFRGRAGRLTVPAGGYTAGELFVLGPRTGYRIDTAPHGFAASFEIGPALVAALTGTWSVVDPVEVVARRISDLEHACVSVLRDRVAAALPGPASGPGETRDRLAAAFAEGVAVPGGVRLDGLHVEVTATDPLTADRLIHLLVADEEETDPADPGGADPAELLRELADLARQGLAGHTGDDAAARALARFAELVDRMHEVLPVAGERTAHDQRG